MIPGLEFGQIRYAAPGFLWLLILPALLLGVWVWRLVALRADVRRLARRRTLPVRERLTLFCDLPFWLCLIGALTVTIVAIARPVRSATVLRRAGIDLVILQDGSASMRVADVSGDRWQRSTRFIRVLGEALSWKDDRIAMAVFARIAAPQVRLTKDPNTFFFFLDHLDRQSPFRLEEDGTWDTNLELGIHWGLRLIERDEELHGKSPNAKLFVTLSDGELWSGNAATSLARARARGIPVDVVGVGTLAGGAMPVPRVVRDIFRNPSGEEVRDPDIPLRSSLDREGLQRIASTGGGRYFELDRDRDRQIASSIVDAAKRRAPTLDITEEAQELYWYFLSVAAAFVTVGLLFLRERAELWMQLVGAVLILAALSSILR